MTTSATPNTPERSPFTATVRQVIREELFEFLTPETQAKIEKKWSDQDQQEGGEK